MQYTSAHIMKCHHIVSFVPSVSQKNNIKVPIQTN